MIARRPKRAVRIVKKRQMPRAALVSFIVSGGVALVLFVGWRAWTSADEPVKPTVRELSDVPMTWRCENGHSFHLPGRPGFRSCPRCGAQAYLYDKYACPVHGEFDVYIRLKPEWSDENRVFDRRIGDGPWKPQTEQLVCPRCGRELRRVGEGPFARPRPKRRGP